MRVPPSAGACESASVQAGSEAVCSSTRSAWCRETARSVLRMISHSGGDMAAQAEETEEETDFIFKRERRSMNVLEGTMGDVWRWPVNIEAVNVKAKERGQTGMK